MLKNFNNKKLLLQIWITFLRIGPVTFGGGYTIIALLERETVEKRKWMKSSEIADIVAVAGSVPGALAINTAIFVGYRLAGAAGAITAMIGVLLPTFCIIVGLSIGYMYVQDYPKVEAALVAIRATVAALITYAAIRVGKTAVVDKTSALLVLVTVLVLLLLPIHPIWIILAGGIGGIAIVFLRNRIGLHTRLDEGGVQEYKYDDYFIGDGI